MHRLGLSWHGGEGKPGQPNAAFRTLLWITIIYLVTREAMAWSFPYILSESGMLAMTYAFESWRLIYGVLVVCVVARARAKVRERYEIPNHNCGAVEDVCCSLWCTCCTVAQISRHTADYENYPALCCSETGLAPNAPAAAYASRCGTSEYHAPSLDVV